jgi:DNA-binding LacI/PurR family transcriptional regulator
LKEKRKIIEIGQQTPKKREYNFFLSKPRSKHERKTTLTHLTALTPSETRMKKIISVPFYPALTNKISKKLKHQGIQLVCFSANYKLKRQLSRNYERYNSNCNCVVYVSGE